MAWRRASRLRRRRSRRLIRSPGDPIALQPNIKQDWRCFSSCRRELQRSTALSVIRAAQSIGSRRRSRGSRPRSRAVSQFELRLPTRNALSRSIPVRMESLERSFPDNPPPCRDSRIGFVKDVARGWPPRPSRFSLLLNPRSGSRHIGPEVPRACPCQLLLEPWLARERVPVGPPGLRSSRTNPVSNGSPSTRTPARQSHLRAGSQRTTGRLLLVSKAGSVFRAKSDSPWCQRTCVTR